ncbi:hypothetical protein BL250_01005 [Erwinia sp. OLTSP20]|nr:hypothetical protein BV501_15445 [Erwinia sp. OAMSP11]PIJ69313.1 hypothetical protein BK416_14390 [Erwinia sp. OLSSP12]PIJ79147.1 hypothetical protein BLD47_14695 [Erwinia sp. OLCASP19]PIJ80673.1 hypothetical protein BLD46_13855 [Erwinia sp. OLMTSP26]PIJ91677.1 hypothetical protein BL249_07560 [Erwinia sp. OLFS4]PIJ95349.1 hypothetical protein BL250_01005 [Erwinia sp. OLTSP20]
MKVISGCHPREGICNAVSGLTKISETEMSILVYTIECDADSTFTKTAVRGRLGRNNGGIIAVSSRKKRLVYNGMDA